MIDGAFPVAYDVAADLLGESAAMVALRTLVVKFGRREANVLLQGESGTGKELIARALQRLSKRWNGPFVSVNCAAIPDGLADSEFFGHERGSFTGASGLHRGFFEQANRGTLFLDEIGEMSPLLQAKLLRALQEREIRRVGGIQTIPVDVRVIAATNRDLQNAVLAKTFRADLYFRLRQLSIKVPPLRERDGDIPILIRHFIAKYAAANDLSINGITTGASARLQQYDWPGNVRELESIIGQAMEQCSGDVIKFDDLPDEVFPAGVDRRTTSILTMDQYLWQQKRKYAEFIYVHVAERDYEHAAILLGIHPSGFHAFIQRLGLGHLLQ